MAKVDWAGGLKPHHEYMLSERPDDPELRESASIWLYDDSGEFGFPRIGIEAQGKEWDNHRFDANFAFADGRVLKQSTRAPTRPSIDAEGKSSILGAGGLMFRCLEPFRRWQIRYDGDAVDTTTKAMILREIDSSKRVPVKFDVEIEMAAPALVQDNTPEKLATMSERERIDAGLMGFGFRKEQLFRATGVFEFDGETRDVRATGLRVHRQSVRPMGEFRGHCWQSAVFPDGRAFGYVTYPPAADGSTYNEGYIYQDGEWYDAVATKVPFLRGMTISDEDCSLELKSELGVTRIEATTRFNTYKPGSPDTMGLTLHQGGARYTWDGQTAYGMIERSSPEELAPPRL